MGYLRWLYLKFRSEIVAIPWRLISLIFVVFLMVFPLVLPHPYVLRILALSLLFSLFAASWDFLAGFTGQLSLGHAFFFGASAYTSALLNTKLNLPPWTTIPLSALVAAMAGLILCLPALRLRGIYLALVTLVFPFILSGLVHVFSGLTGGELGISGLDRLGYSPIFNYYLILAVTVISLLIMWKFTDTRSKLVRTGVLLHAIREDEITARATGVATTRYKIMAFAISGFFAGIAGGLYAHFIRIVGPSVLDLLFSFNALVWTVFGGITTLYGPVAGVFILYPITELLRLHPIGEEIRFLIQAIIMIIVLLFMPQGLTRWIRDQIEDECPRCKLVNFTVRRVCRGCRAPLHLEK